MTTQPTLFQVRDEHVQRALTIRELPITDQPVNRIRYLGSGSLSLRELLAIVVGGNDGFQIADNILRYASQLSDLARLSFYELVSIPGVGPSTAARLQALTELACRLQREAPQEQASIRSPSDIANLLQLEMALLDHEQLRIVLLDTKNRVQDVITLYKGSLNTAVVRVGEVFKEALKRNMAAIIIVHNHPSGDPTPSPEDVLVTQKIVQAGELLNIDVLDHLVIGYNRFVSLKERGLGF